MPERSATDQFLSGKTVAAIRWCSRCCRAAKDCEDRRRARVPARIACTFSRRYTCRDERRPQNRDTVARRRGCRSAGQVRRTAPRLGRRARQDDRPSEPVAQPPRELGRVHKFKPMGPQLVDVRFAPESGHWGLSLECPLRAMNGHSPEADQLEGRMGEVTPPCNGAAERDGADDGACTLYDVRPHACASIFHSSPCFENVYASVPVRVAVWALMVTASVPAMTA